ncbi:TetR/AcrR family transcriptional regulator [Maridesulfovibrio zosterae]|uniref:TetR/AcrR family transcriptional regulator n=1 Tax=Maridesulfovibrio zosterae TaxID=82171 RepID=UPI0003F82953|nr:TetR/AcrR family transcriptional regulator [Maridesulfovibrio zosterae]
MVQMVKDTVRNQIRLAAEEMFTNAGFKKTTLVDITQEADSATGTIYEYYPNMKSPFKSIITEEFVEEFSSLTGKLISFFMRPEGFDLTLSYVDSSIIKLHRRQAK